MDEYMTILLEQIRHKKARAAVEGEIRQHIEEQAAAYEAGGMEKDEAMYKAVQDMGDPVTAGVELDRVHRPRMAWGMLLLVGIISALSILIQIVIGMGDKNLGDRHITNHIMNVITGLLLMSIVYRRDYSFIGKYAKYIAAVFAIFLFVSIFWLGLEFNGARRFVRIPGMPRAISLVYVMYLFMPIYAALLYSYRGSRYGGIMKSLLWMLFIPWLCMCMPVTSLAVTMFYMMALLFSFAVWKNWFYVKRLPFLISFWSAVLILPGIWTMCAMRFRWIADYKIERLQGLLSFRSNDYNYVAQRVREYMGNSLFIGNSGNQFADYLPSYESEQLLTFLASYYGMAVAFAAFAVILYIVGRIFGIALKQRNQLGMMMGCACGLVFLVQTLMHILVNFGLTSMPTTLPFFSSGGTGVEVSYILLGIVLSIYRYQDILPLHPKESAWSKKIKLPKISILIEKSS